MKRKYVQIRMNVLHHDQAKNRAKQLDLPIGEYYENLVVLMEMHLKKAYEITNLQEGSIDEKMLRVLFRTELKLSKDDLEKELSATTQSTTTTSSNFLSKTSITV